MRRARKIHRGVTITAVVVSLTLPAFARANPLLSGYGAPGQGSQALLGSALAGPRGGGSSGASREGAAQPIEQSAPTPTPTGQSAVAEPSGSRGGSHARTGRPGSSHTGAGGATKGSSAPASGPRVARVVALEPKSSVHVDAAGISGGDLALIVLAIGVIFATGALTTRLARGGKSPGGGG
jgi:hypothetical protein